MADTFSYGKCNANYWQEQYPGIFDKLQGATKHANLSQPTPRKAKRTVVPRLKPPERAGDVIRLTLPIPPKALNPNGRVHWSVKHKSAAALKEQAAVLMRVVARGEHWNAARIDVTLWGPKRFDADNLIASLKHAFDGIAETIDCNDRYFQIGDVRQHTGKQSEGRREVELTLTRLEPERCKIR